MCAELTKAVQHNGAVAWLGDCLSSVQEPMGSLANWEREKGGGQNKPITRVGMPESLSDPITHFQVVREPKKKHHDN